MSDLFGPILAFLLFLLGLRLSAFFSGSETGFYRASFLRLNLDTKAKDPAASRLLWFAQHPSHFVATTLIGNNLANYLTTFAIGYGVVQFAFPNSDVIEVALTLALSPLIFVFGELIPKNLFYRSPISLLKSHSLLFLWFYRAFWIIVLPLVGITKLLEYLTGTEKRTLDLFLGRSRLEQVLSHGHQEGILTEIQSRLVSGLIQTADQSVTASVTPADRVLGLPETVSCDEVLEYARKYGITHIAFHREGAPTEWFGYTRTLDAAVSKGPVKPIIKTMPQIDSTARKLQALMTLRASESDYGLVVSSGKILGTIYDRGLVEQLFRANQTTAGTP